jgi:hypothetical protein
VKGKLHIPASTPLCGVDNRPGSEKLAKRQLVDCASRAQKSYFQDCGLRAPFMKPPHGDSMGTARPLPRAVLPGLRSFPSHCEG